MRFVKIVALLVLLLVAGAAGVALYGVPAGGAIERAAREPLARQGLALTIGDAKLSILPASTLTLDDVRLTDTASGQLVASVERVAAGIAAGDLWSGKLRFSDVTATKPVVDAEGFGKRKATPAGPAGPSSGAGSVTGRNLLPAGAAVAVDTLTIENGTILLRDGDRRRDIPIERVTLARIPGQEGGTLQLDARSGASTLRLVAPGDAPSRLVEGVPTPLEAKVEAPDLFAKPLQLKGTVLHKGPVFEITGLDGALDQGRLRGKVSISFASARPFVDATLESDRLVLAALAPPPRGTPAGTAPSSRSDGGRAGTEPWSDAPIAALSQKLPEGSLVFSARELVIGRTTLAPVSLEATSLDDVVTVKVGRAGFHEGQIAGEAKVDRAKGDPALALKGTFSGVNTLSAATDLADFRHLEGRARGSVDLTSTGASQKRIVEALRGRAEVAIENGAVRGVDLPRMVDRLLEMVLAGWQASPSDQTRFTKASASAVIENGVARTNDVALTGPRIAMSAAGSADLRAKTLAFRADPRIVSAGGDQAPQGGTGASGATAIGVPVMIEGPWSAPRIYADTPGILSDPEAALKALRGQLHGDAPLGKLIEGLGKTIQPNQPGRDPGTLADDLIRALRGDQPPSTPPGQAPPAAQPAPAPAPQAPPTAQAPPAAQAPPVRRQPPAQQTQPSAREDARTRAEREQAIRDLEQGARDLLRDFLGGGGTQPR